MAGSGIRYMVFAIFAAVLWPLAAGQAQTNTAASVASRGEITDSIDRI